MSDTICAILGYGYHDDTRHLTSAVALVKSLLDRLPWTFREDETEYAILGSLDDIRRTNEETIGLIEAASIIEGRLAQLCPLQFRIALANCLPFCSGLPYREIPRYLSGQGRNLHGWSADTTHSLFRLFTVLRA